jgi:NTE family protein
MRPITTLLVTPSVNLTSVAEHHQKDMPYLIQYFVNSLGRDAASCSDLMSYLLFTPKYTRDLIALGYHDAGERIDEIESYLYSPDEEDDGGPSEGAAGIGKSRPITSTRKRISSSSKSRD